MRQELYNQIFKRKSFHLFRNIGKEKISSEELKDIEETFYTFIPLVKDIKVRIKIIKDVNTCRRGQEYCVLFYSEVKDNYLQNIGYLGEQLDLYLVSKNIGTLWFGIGKNDEMVDGLTFVIMMAIAKVDSQDKFRKDMYKSKRKALTEIWEGDHYKDIGDIVRFAPSACNSQPWLVKANDKQLEVYRYHDFSKRGIMPKDKVNFYNQIDIGIFICFLDLVLDNKRINYKKEIFVEENHEAPLNKITTYKMID